MNKQEFDINNLSEPIKLLQERLDRLESAYEAWLAKGNDTTHWVAVENRNKVKELKHAIDVLKVNPLVLLMNHDKK